MHMPKSKQAIAPSKRHRLSYTCVAAPHADVHVRAEDFNRSVYLVYTGTHELLIASGAVEPHMLLGARTCGSGKDSRGNRYRRKLSGRNGRIEVARYIRSPEMLRTFPGYEENWTPEAIRWLGKNPRKLHISSARVDEQEQVTGTKEAFIAEGLATAADFDRLNGYADISSVEGYKQSRLCECMDGYYCVDRLKLPPPRQFTPANYAKIIGNFLGCAQDTVNDHFGAETQSRVSHHIDIILESIDCELRQSTPRPSFLRLVVDNTRTT
jgi:hypothetical protein